MSTNHSPHITVPGNLVDDPVFSTDDGGTVICEFVLMNPSSTASDAHRSFFHVRCRGMLASNIEERDDLIYKGAWVRVTGRMQVLADRVVLNASDVARSLLYGAEE